MRSMVEGYSWLDAYTPPPPFGGSPPQASLGRNYFDILSAGPNLVWTSPSSTKPHFS